MLPQSFINEIKEKVDMIELVSEYTSLSKAGTNVWMGRCPHPKHNDSSPSFRIFKAGYKNGKNINKYDSWACFGCHQGGKDNKTKTKNFGSDCFAFYQWMEGVTWKQSILDLAEKYKIPIPSSQHDKLYREKKIQTQVCIDNLYEEPLHYLYNRGLSAKEIYDWRIGWDGQKIVFPLMDRYKNVVAFTKRWLEVPEGRNDKYKNSKTSKIFNKSCFFYGAHNINNEFNELRITEGPMDVIMANKYKAINVVATLGTAFTDEHVEVIKSLGLVPVLIMDGDYRGIEAGEKAITKLADAGVYSKILILPGGKDLCDLSKELGDSIESYISNHSITYGQYKVNTIVNGFDSDLNELKLKRYPDIKEILEEIPYEPERMIMKEYIMDKLNIRM